MNSLVLDVELKMDTMPSFTDSWTNAIFLLSEWLLELEGLELLLLWSWLLGPCCVDTAHHQCFELEYVVMRYVYKFRVRHRARFVVAILLHKSQITDWPQSSLLAWCRSANSFAKDPRSKCLFQLEDDQYDLVTFWKFPAAAILKKRCNIYCAIARALAI